MTECLYLQKKPKNSTMSLQKLYDNGQLEEKLSLLLPLEDTEDIRSFVRMIMKMNEHHISTQECLQKNKKTTLNTKSHLSKKNIQTTKSSQILDQELIQTEKILKPFWTEYSMEQSKKLWLPTKTACQDSVLTSYNSFVENSALNLLLLTTKKIKNQPKNLQKTLCPSLPFSQQDITEAVNINYARKIRIYPNQEQFSLFSKCFGASRFFYNKGVECINNIYKKQFNEYKKLSETSCIYENKKGRCENNVIENGFYCDKHKNNKIKWDIPLNLPKLRPLVMKSDTDLNEDEMWQKEIPYDTRQLVLKDLIGNYKSCITNKKRGHIDKFNVGFKSKKNPNQVFFSSKTAIKDFCIFKRRLKNKSKLKTRKRHSCYNNYTPKHDFIVLKEYDKYYIIIPKERKTTFQQTNYNSVSLDPGVRTFQTYYSPDGICGKIGDKIQNTINTLSTKVDNFKSLITKQIKRRTIRNMKKRCNLLITKVKNIVRNLHWQACSFLVKNFQNIIIPHFKSKDMSNKNNRKINKTTTRNMLGLSHFKFLEKLKFKCLEYQRNLIITSEEYTSKTCGNCGVLNHTLGGSKVFKCNKCKVVMDRDINGARNILIKYLTGLDTTL